MIRRLLYYLICTSSAFAQFTYTNVETVFDYDNDGISYILSSHTYDADKVYIIAIFGGRSGTAPAAPSIDSTAGSWTLITTTDLFDSDRRLVTASWYKPASGETETIGLNFTGADYFAVAWSLIEITGIDLTTPVNAFKDTARNSNGTSISVTLASAPGTDNEALAFVMAEGSSDDITPDAQFTEIAEAIGTGGAGNGGMMESQRETSTPGEQNCISVWSTSGQAGAIILDLNEAAAPPAAAPTRRRTVIIGELNETNLIPVATSW